MNSGASAGTMRTPTVGVKTAELLMINTSGDEQINSRECEDHIKEGQNDVYHSAGEVLRSNTSKSGDEHISWKEYVDRIKEGQNDISYITDESIAVVSSPFSENLHKKGHEVPYTADPVDERALHQFKEFGGKMLKSATKEGFDLGDDNERNKIEELKAEFKPLTKLMKEILGDNVEEAMVSDRIVDSPCVSSTSEYGCSAKMERIMEAQALRDNSMTSRMPLTTRVRGPAVQAEAQQQHKSSKQSTQQERGEGKKERSEKVEREEWETVVVKERKGQRERGQEGRGEGGRKGT